MTRMQLSLTPQCEDSCQNISTLTTARPEQMTSTDNAKYFMAGFFHSPVDSS